MITKLENSNTRVAEQIYQVFQSSYQIEAQLIGVSDFPPLKRTVGDIVNSDNAFYGFFEREQLAAVIEVAIVENQLDINSLTVAPDFFRKGIASKLIEFIITTSDFTEATVETAAANKPAIKLYQKHGFVDYKRFTPAHGIEKLALSLQGR